MELAQIKSRTAVGAGPASSVEKTHLAFAGAALWAPARGHLIERGRNSMAQLAPKYFVPNANPALVRPLPCSLALPGCRKYVELRETLLKKASAVFEPPAVKKKRVKKKRHKHKRKRKRHRRYD
jgi:hypothetical protein